MIIYVIYSRFESDSRDAPCFWGVNGWGALDDARTYYSKESAQKQADTFDAVVMSLGAAERMDKGE